MKNDASVPEPETAAPAETPRQKFERERMTRRAALAKIGLRAGATAFAFFSLDDMARMVMGRMAENKEMGQVANIVGREFKNAGVAFADDIIVTCKHCTNQVCLDDASCIQAYSHCVGCTSKTVAACKAVYDSCKNNSTYSYVQCALAANCPVDGAPLQCPPVPELPCDQAMLF